MRELKHYAAHLLDKNCLLSTKVKQELRSLLLCRQVY